ncbi:MAG: RNA methyltransferase [Clostridia bacterium]|nr:RNA methyltransferase [Clostridia bacterium]
MKQLPVEFEKRMKTLLGDEFESYKKSMDESPIRAFRVNTGKISVEKFEKINVFPTKSINYVNGGYYFDYDKIGNHPYHHAGIIYVQEPGAMAPAECIEINPEWTVLDMCAAPGGKTSRLRNKLNKESVLVSNEIIPSRCRILTGNIERMGFENTVITCMDTAKLAATFPSAFDLIMVDAPCSGEGMFRKDDTAIEEWSIENVHKCAERQAEILDNAISLLKSDGYIIYATCTFSLEENEMTVDAFLQRHNDFELVPVTDKIKSVTSDGIAFDGCKCDVITHCRRFYPHKSPGEGQFMAVLHRTGNCDVDIQPTITQHPIKVDKSVFDFLDDTLIEYKKQNVTIYNGNPVYFAPYFTVNKGTAFACGVNIGEIKKNYILPHHQFFMSLGHLFRRKIELTADSEEIKKYLHGEEISATCENGWAVVMVDGCAVGGAKISGGKAKDHYPKGLRTLY